MQRVAGRCSRTLRLDDLSSAWAVQQAHAGQILPAFCAMQKEGPGTATHTVPTRAFVQPAEELQQPIIPPFEPRVEELEGDAHVPKGAKTQGFGAHPMARYRYVDSMHSMMSASLRHALVAVPHVMSPQQ